jgi:serine/threonine protein kinase
MPEVGARFGPYLLTRLIGSGGMGQVFEAHDTTMDRVVALKLISGPNAMDPDYRQRLQREARIAGRLHEPHVVPIHATGEIDGHLYVDMRLIDGTDLDSILKRFGPMPPARAVAIVRQVASALDAAHAAGVLHRDVKPANILVTSDGFSYLVDFGIANAASEEKLTKLGDVLGTYAYMAPERFSGNSSAISPAADVYALACVLFEAVTGSPPFTGDRISVMGAHLSQPIPRVSVQARVPQALDDVILRGMAKNPNERFRTAGDLARTAEDVLTSGVETSNLRAPHLHAAPTSPAHSVPPANTIQTWANGGTAGPTHPHQQASLHGGPPVATTPKVTHRLRWTMIAAAAIVVALVAGIGIWRLTSGTSPQAIDSTQAVDLNKLDVGRYPTEPRPLPGPPTEDEGRMLEAFRLAEGIANPFDVDPKLSYVLGLPVPGPKQAATAMAGTATPIVQPVLEKRGMISAYLVDGYSVPSGDFSDATNKDAMGILVASFPNPESATLAAAEIDATDFAVNPENQHLEIPGYPQSKAHYRPGYTNLVATTAQDRLVVHIFYGRVTSDPVGVSDLTLMVQRVLDKQLPLMDKVNPVADAALTLAAVDPDHMFSRAFVAGPQPAISNDFATIGPQAVYICASSEDLKQRMFGQNGVDRCTDTPSGRLLRARDDAAATALLAKLVESAKNDLDREIESPAGLTTAKCHEQKQTVWSNDQDFRFVCWVSFGRYVAFVFSGKENDVRQRAAAQYAILVNSEA